MYLEPEPGWRQQGKGIPLGNGVSHAVDSPSQEKIKTTGPGGSLVDHDNT